MRYTTVIDITTITDVWRNKNTARLYYYMAMVCGYQDNDRDLLDKSIRGLAADAGMTISACRNALRQLQRSGLLTKEQDGHWRICKFVLQDKPSKRAKTKQQEQDMERARERELRDQERERQQARDKEAYDPNESLEIRNKLAKRFENIPTYNPKKK